LSSLSYAYVHPLSAADKVMTVGPAIDNEC